MKGSIKNYDSRLLSETKMNSLVIIVAVNMLVFISLYFLKILSYLRFPEGSDMETFFRENILSWMALSSLSWLSRFWTIITQGFTHADVWQLFGNMIWLSVFGYIFTTLTGHRRIVPVYLYGTLIASGVYIICSSLMRVPPYYFGAGAATMAVAAAAATTSPGYKILPFLNGGISLWIVALAMAVIRFATLPVQTPVLHLAELAAAATGFIYIFLMRKGIDTGAWMTNLFDKINDIFNPDVPRKKASRMAKYHFPMQQKSVSVLSLDKVLDKISQYGYESLNEQEKDFLLQVSKDENER